MYYPSSENKGADQLPSFWEADLRLCFRLCKLLVFPCGSLSVSSLVPGLAREIVSEALPGVWGIQGEGLFIFRDLGRRVIYFQGFGEKA